MHKKIIGIDVGKKELQIAHKYQTSGGKFKVQREKFPNSLKGHVALLGWAEKIANKEGKEDIHFIMEATGVYYEGIAIFLHDAGCNVSVVNPRYVKSFAASCGVRTKTDSKDALVLVEYGSAMHPDLWTPPPPEYRILLSYHRAIDSLKQRRTAILNRIEALEISHTAPGPILEEERRLLVEVNESIKRLEQQIKSHVGKHPGLKKEVGLLMTISGIAWITAVLLVAVMEGGRRFKRAREAAAYLGLSVSEKLSGTSLKGRSRLSKRGPGDIRKALYFPAITAVRYNPDVKVLYNRLIQRGKVKMVAIGAAMRKLVHIAFGVLKHGQTYMALST